MSIGRLALKSFRHSAGKTVIFMIVLSVMLLSAVLNIATSLQRTMYEQGIAESGTGHFKFTNITKAQTEYLAGFEQMEWADEMLVLHWGGTVPTSEEAIHLMYFEGLGLREGFYLKSGRAPQAENEVALPPHTARLIGIEPRVGERFNMTMRDADGNEWPVEMVVSGVMPEMTFYAAQGTQMLFASEAFALAHGRFITEYGENADNPFSGFDTRELLVHLRDGIPVKETALAIGEIAGLKEIDIRFNEQYLRLNLFDPAAVAAIGGILFVLMLMGALVIYNAFNIIVARKTNEYGLMTLVGASQSQIRRCVQMEALLNAACAIPLGLLLGTGFSYLFLPVLRSTVAELNLVFYVTPWAYALTVLLALVMVFFGVLRPARKAAKVVPVEAVRFAAAPEKYRKRREERNIRLPVLAKLNMKRNRGRTVGTILSLSISGVLFLMISTVAFSLVDSVPDMARGSMAGDIQMSTGRKEKGGSIYRYDIDSFSEKTMRGINAIDSVKKVSVFYAQHYRQEEAEQAESGMRSPFGAIAGVDDAVFAEMIKKVSEGKPTYADFENTLNVLAVDANDIYASPFNFSLMQNALLYLQNERGEDGGRTVEIRVIGIINKADIPPYVDIRGNLPLLIMPLKAYEANGFRAFINNVNLEIDEAKHDAILANLDAVCEENGNVQYKSFLAMVRETQRLLIGVISLIMAALFIVALVGILNLISATVIGIQQRQHEFGVLEALGLSKRGLNKLLLYEGARVGAASILISAIIGLLGGYGLYQAMVHSGVSYLRFAFPIVPLIILLLIYGLVPYSVTWMAIKRLNRRTTVELLRQAV